MAEINPKHFYGDSMPVGASEQDEWTKTNKDHYVYCDGAWVLQGNRGQENMGLMSTLGALVSGLIEGAHGLATESNPNFKGSARREGLNLIDESQLEQMEKRMIQRLSGLVATAITTGSGGAVSKNFVIKKQWKMMGDTELWQPDKPLFNGADEADYSLTTWFAYIQGFQGPNGAMEFNFGYPSGWWLEESTTSPYTVRLHARQLPGGIASGQCKVVVIAVAVR